MLSGIPSRARDRIVREDGLTSRETGRAECLAGEVMVMRREDPDGAVTVGPPRAWQWRDGGDAGLAQQAGMDGDGCGPVQTLRTCDCSPGAGVAQRGHELSRNPWGSRPFRIDQRDGPVEADREHVLVVRQRYVDRAVLEP